MLAGGSRDKITNFYSDIQTMDLLNLTPTEWAGLHRWDKAALKYYLAAKLYKERQAHEQAKAKAEQEARYRRSLPAQRLSRR